MKEELLFFGELGAPLGRLLDSTKELSRYVFHCRVRVPVQNQRKMNLPF